MVLVYDQLEDRAAEMAEHLEKNETIRGVPIRTELTRDSSFQGYHGIPVAGIFITEKIDPGLDAVIRFAVENHAIVFSPFEGDVEAGVTGGIVISGRLLPYVNMEALRVSGIQIKPFFLKITEQYK